jgi:hypothetical protein
MGGVSQLGLVLKLPLSLPPSSIPLLGTPPWAEVSVTSYLKISAWFWK